MFGQRLRLKTDTIATTSEDGNVIAIQVPAGAEILVLDQIQPNVPHTSTRQVDVLWQGKALSMFLVDIRERCEPIPPPSKGRAASQP